MTLEPNSLHYGKLFKPVWKERKQIRTDSDLTTVSLSTERWASWLYLAHFLSCGIFQMAGNLSISNIHHLIGIKFNMILAIFVPHILK